MPRLSGKITDEGVAELARRLSGVVEGQVLHSVFDRGRYATDASVYQMMPHAVVIPRTFDDVCAGLSIAEELDVPVLPRGGGTSQCGQTVNHALVFDNTPCLNGLVSLDVEARRCVVEPGMVLDELNRHLAKHGLWFPVDVSTASRATIGGMAANNSCGQRSIYYGTMRDNVHSIDALLAGGDIFSFTETDDHRHLPMEQRQLYETLLAIGANAESEVRERFPRVQRRVGGYNLDALVAGGAHRFSDVLVGSEGTLGYFKQIELKLSPLPVNKVLGVCHFPSFHQAMDAAQHLVKLSPRAVELVDSTMIALAQEIDIYQPMVQQFVRGNPAAILVVEFAFDDAQANLRQLDALDDCMADLGLHWDGKGTSQGGVVRAMDAATQSAIAEVRKAGLNIMMSMKSEGKPVSFVEDCAVELEDLASYTAELTEVFERHGTRGTWYAHASVGCLHVRPILNLKLDQDALKMRAIADEAFDLVLKYKGSHSGEHGDGISRSEFHEKMFGSKLVAAFAEVKRCFDPNNRFNPGKITAAPAMNDRHIMRYQPGYHMQAIDNRMQWQGWSGEGGGLQGAIEMCNNNGACRKLQGGVMCPSYRVTRNERDVTRGRANVLRLALSNQLGANAMASDEMHDSLRLCVSCKACKRECPTGVDMAKMKIEAQAARAAVQGYSLRDRLVAYLPAYAPLAAKVPWLANARNHLPPLAWLLQRTAKITSERPLPAFRRDWFSQLQSAGDGKVEVVLLADTFNTWFEPENLHAAIKVLVAMGCQVHIAHDAQQPRRRLCCGRTYLAAGMIDQARAEAERMAAVLLPYAKRGVSIVGLEPSCLLTLRDEHLSLLPEADAQCIADNAYLLEEFIADVLPARGGVYPSFKALNKTALVHGHCHQKAFNAMSAVNTTLALIPELNVRNIESSCCGMAGAFGYGADTIDVSKKMAGLNLVPAVEQSDDADIIVADGTSCRHQIDDLVLRARGRSATHVARLLEQALP